MCQVAGLGGNIGSLVIDRLDLMKLWDYKLFIQSVYLQIGYFMYT